MTLVEAATDIFADAKQLHAEAMARFETGDILDAADKAWCATKRATDALILVRSGQMPEKTPDTSRQLGYLAMQDGTIRVLAGRYYSRQSQLHGDCSYCGMCEPLAETERRIRETAGYIEDAERLALGQDLASVSERLGHSAVSMTADIRSHALPGWQKQAAETFADTMEE